MNPLDKTQIIVSLAVGALAGAIPAGAAGYWLSQRHATTKAEAVRQETKAEEARALYRATEFARLRYQAETIRANGLEKQLLTDQQRFANEKRQLQQRISHVTTVYRPAPGAALAPIPRTVFTVGFVRDYNAAIGLPANGAPAAAGSAGDQTDPAAAAGAGLLDDSGLSQADILAHISDYGERCRRLDSQVNRLIDRLEGEPQ